MDNVRVTVSSAVENVSVSVDSTTEVVTVAVTTAVASLVVIRRSTAQGAPVDGTTAADYLGQQCIVGDDPGPYLVYVAGRVSPSVWSSAGSVTHDDVIAAIGYTPATAAQGTDERVPTAAGLTTKFGTNKATIADGDMMAMLDSESTDPVNQPKHGLWSLIKSTLKTYLDGLHVMLAQGTTPQTLARDGPAFINFKRSDIANNAKVSIGQIGSGEANVCWNLDYTLGTDHHQYWDSTLYATWYAMGGSTDHGFFAIQTCPPGSTATDIWADKGKPYIWSSYHNATYGACIFIGGAGMSPGHNDVFGPSMPQYARLVIPRDGAQCNICGMGDMYIEGRPPPDGSWGVGDGVLYLNMISNAIINFGSGQAQFAGNVRTAGSFVMMSAAFGVTVFSNANTGATNYAITVPAASGMLLLAGTTLAHYGITDAATSAQGAKADTALQIPIYPGMTISFGAPLSKTVFAIFDAMEGNQPLYSDYVTGPTLQVYPITGGWAVAYGTNSWHNTTSASTPENLTGWVKQGATSAELTSIVPGSPDVPTPASIGAAPSTGIALAAISFGSVGASIAAATTQTAALSAIGASANMTRRHATAGLYDYLGKAVAGSSKSASVWTILQVTLSTGASATATNVKWDDVLTATYT